MFHPQRRPNTRLGCPMPLYRMDFQSTTGVSPSEETKHKAWLSYAPSEDGSPEHYRCFTLRGDQTQGMAVLCPCTGWLPRALQVFHPQRRPNTRLGCPMPLYRMAPTGVSPSEETTHKAWLSYAPVQDGSPEHYRCFTLRGDQTQLCPCTGWLPKALQVFHPQRRPNTRLGCPMPLYRMAPQSTTGVSPSEETEHKAWLSYAPVQDGYPEHYRCFTLRGDQTQGLVVLYPCTGWLPRALQVFHPQRRPHTRLGCPMSLYRMAPQSTTGVSPSEETTHKAWLSYVTVQDGSPEHYRCFTLRGDHTQGLAVLGSREHYRCFTLRGYQTQGLAVNECNAGRKSDMMHNPFTVGDTVYMKNFGPGCKWLSRMIRKVTRPVSYESNLEDGQQRRCHQDHLRTLEPLDSITAATTSIVTTATTGNRGTYSDPPSLKHSYPSRNHTCLTYIMDAQRIDVCNLSLLGEGMWYLIVVVLNLWSLLFPVINIHDFSAAVNVHK